LEASTCKKTILSWRWVVEVRAVSLAESKVTWRRAPHVHTVGTAYTQPPPSCLFMDLCRCIINCGLSSRVTVQSGSQRPLLIGGEGPVSPGTGYDVEYYRWVGF